MGKFQEYDKDDSGFVTGEEAAMVLTKQCPGLSAECIKTTVKRFDTSGDDKMNYKEFVYFYAHCSAMWVTTDGCFTAYRGSVGFFFFFLFFGAKLYIIMIALTTYVLRMVLGRGTKCYLIDGLAGLLACVVPSQFWDLSLSAITHLLP